MNNSGEKEQLVWKRHVSVMEGDVEELSSCLQRHKLQQLLSDGYVHLVNKGGVRHLSIHGHTLLQLPCEVLVERDTTQRVVLSQLHGGRGGGLGLNDDYCRVS